MTVVKRNDEKHVIAEKIVRNVLYRRSQYSPFTFSSIVDESYLDHTGLPEYVSNFLLIAYKSGSVIEHFNGPMKIVRKDKGHYGRNGRPTNLYQLSPA